MTFEGKMLPDWSLLVALALAGYSRLCSAYPAYDEDTSPIGPTNLFEQNIDCSVANIDDGRRIVEEWISDRGDTLDFKFDVTLVPCEGARIDNGRIPQFKYVGTYDAREALDRNNGLDPGMQICKNIVDGGVKFNDYCKMILKIDPVNLYTVGLPHVSLGFDKCRDRGKRNIDGATALDGNKPLWCAAGLLNFEKRVNSTSAKTTLDPVKFGAGEYDLNKLRTLKVIPDGASFESIVAENAIADAALWAKIVDAYEPKGNFDLEVNPTEKHVHWYEAQPISGALNNPKNFGEVALVSKGNINRPVQFSVNE